MNRRIFNKILCCLPFLSIKDLNVDYEVFFAKSGIYGENILSVYKDSDGHEYWAPAFKYRLKEDVQQTISNMRKYSQNKYYYVVYYPRSNKMMSVIGSNDKLFLQGSRTNCKIEKRTYDRY